MGLNRAVFDRLQECAVVGDSMPDCYLQGQVEPVSPEVVMPVVRRRARRPALGGATRVASNHSVLGVGPTSLYLMPSTQYR